MPEKAEAVLFYTCGGDVTTYLEAKDWMMANNALVGMWMWPDLMCLKEFRKEHKILSRIADVPYGIRSGQLWSEVQNHHRFLQVAV